MTGNCDFLFRVIRISMNVKINSHITANLYYSIVALFYMRHASPVGKCWKNLFVQCIMYYQALNLLSFCSSVLNLVSASIFLTTDPVQKGALHSNKGTPFSFIKSLLLSFCFAFFAEKLNVCYFLCKSLVNRY